MVIPCYDYVYWGKPNKKKGSLKRLPVKSDVKFSSESLGILIALLPGVTGFITVLGVDALGITVLVADETSKVFLFALYASRPVQLPVDPLSAAFAALLAVHDSSCLETKS